MNRLAILAATLTLAGALAGCQDKSPKQFIAEGTIYGAQGQKLYLEEVGTGNVLALDSVVINDLCQFRFVHDGTTYPMFYRLRLQNGASIPFAADSATRISITTGTDNFSGGYTINEGDPYNHQIRDINLLRQRTDRRIDSLVSEHMAGRLSLQAVRDSVDSVCIDFKHAMTSHYIYVDPKSPASYFALFQRKGEGAYFSAEDEGDERAFAAVATAYDSYYADAPYTPFLKDMALRAIARSRARRNWARSSEAASIGKRIETIAFPEIRKRDNKGIERSLTELSRKGPVLLSFTAYSAQWSPMLVSLMRKIHDEPGKLHIYEVSIDGDSYYWENAARTLPWISVNDPEGMSLQVYNVQELPAFFLIKDGQLKRLSSPEEALR